MDDVADGGLVHDLDHLDPLSYGGFLLAEFVGLDPVLNERVCTLWHSYSRVAILKVPASVFGAPVSKASASGVRWHAYARRGSVEKAVE